MAPSLSLMCPALAQPMPKAPTLDDGSNPIRIADETVATSPQCSPDGKWVIYLQGSSSTPMRVMITGEKPPEAIAQGRAIWIGNVPAFSPEGKRIAYLATPESPVINPS